MALLLAHAYVLTSQSITNKSGHHKLICMYELNFLLVRIKLCHWDVDTPGCAVTYVKNAYPIRIRMAATPYPHVKATAAERLRR